jgi:hypothetical protein
VNLASLLVGQRLLEREGSSYVDKPFFKVSDIICIFWPQIKLDVSEKSQLLDRIRQGMMPPARKVFPCVCNPFAHLVPAGLLTTYLRQLIEFAYHWGCHPCHAAESTVLRLYAASAIRFSVDSGTYRALHRSCLLRIMSLKKV